MGYSVTMGILNRAAEKLRDFKLANGMREDPELDRISKIVFETDDFLSEADIKLLIASNEHNKASAILLRGIIKGSIPFLKKDEIDILIDRQSTYSLTIVAYAVFHETPLYRYQADTLIAQSTIDPGLQNDILREATHDSKVERIHLVELHLREAWRQSIRDSLPLAPTLTS